MGAELEFDAGTKQVVLRLRRRRRRFGGGELLAHVTPHAASIAGTLESKVEIVQVSACCQMAVQSSWRSPRAWRCKSLGGCGLRFAVASAYIVFVVAALLERGRKVTACVLEIKLLVLIRRRSYMYTTDVPILVLLSRRSIQEEVKA